jgi:lipid-binding SYLF domain-containing protein
MAKGVLVFPGVLEGAFWGGAEYGGDGALRIGGRTVDYYNIAALSFGAQQKDVIFLFMDSNALQDFRKSAGWTVGLDGKVTLVTVGAEGSINSQIYNKPILAFVVDQKGLIAGVSLGGREDHQTGFSRGWNERFEVRTFSHLQEQAYLSALFGGNPNA